MTSHPSETPASAPPGPYGAPEAHAAPGSYAGPGPQAAPGPADGPTSPGSPAQQAPSQFTLPLRQPAAFALLAANGLILLFAIVDMLVIFQDWPDNFLVQIDGSYGDFVGLVSIGFPLLAVLLATHVRPAVPHARLVTVAALVEYAVSALFGVLSLLVSLLHGLTATGTVNGLSSARRAFETFLIRGGWLVVLAVAALAVIQLFQGMYAAPKPAPYPQPGFGYPPPGQPPAYGQPAYTAYGRPAPGYAQPGWAAPSGAYPSYGAPQPATTPQQAYPPAADVSSPYAPYATRPAAQPPAAPAAPAGPPPADTDQTQLIAHQETETQAITPPPGSDER